MAADGRKIAGDRRTKTTGEKIGGVFARAARGPLDYAAGCLISNHIPKALDELEADALMAAFSRGIGDVAELVGVTRSEVESALPYSRVRDIGHRIRSSQPKAVAAWKLYSGQFGMLDVMTALTVDGRQPDLVAAISRVAAKLRHDKGLSDPLFALGADLEALNAALHECQDTLVLGDWLSVALRRKRVRRIALLGSLITLLIASTGAFVYVRIKQSDAKARILAMNDCDIMNLRAEDTAWATSELKRIADSKTKACIEERDLAAAEEARRKAAEEKETARLRAAEAVLSNCKRIADGLTSGELPPDVTLEPPARPLLERIAKKTLEPEDLGPADPTLPCAGTPDEARIQKSFEEAVLADAFLWARRSDPSPKTQAILLARQTELDYNARVGLAETAERTAMAGLSSGDERAMSRAKTLCGLARKLSMPGKSGCIAIEARAEAP